MFCTVREDWEEPTLSEGGTTVGRAWAVTIELVELCGMHLFRLFFAIKLKETLFEVYNTFNLILPTFF